MTIWKTVPSADGEFGAGWRRLLTFPSDVSPSFGSVVVIIEYATVADKQKP